MKAHFEERSTISFLLVMALGLAILFGTVSVVLYQNKTMLPFYIITGLGILLPCLLFYLGSTPLSVKIDAQGVSYKFPPFVGQRAIAWGEIQSAQVVKYNPMKDFGGWGTRYNSTKGKAYTTKGSIGLQLVSKDGQKLLLTIIDEARAKETLAALGK